MRKIFKIIFPFLSVITFIGMTVYVNLDASQRIDFRHYDNVFDEMSQGLRKNTNSKFAKNIGGEEISNQFYTMQDKPDDEYFYVSNNKNGENKKIPRNINTLGVRISKISNKEPIFIYYYYQLTDKLETKIIFEYFKKTQTLSQTLTIMDGGTKSDFQQALTDKGLTVKDFQRQTRDILGRTVIRAWIGAKDSKSHFSEKNWGDVKISSMTVKED